MRLIDRKLLFVFFNWHGATLSDTSADAKNRVCAYAGTD